MTEAIGRHRPNAVITQIPEQQPTPSHPHCPSCGDTGARRLSISALGKLNFRKQGDVAAHFDTAHHCGECGSIYLYRSGISCLVGG